MKKSLLIIIYYLFCIFVSYVILLNLGSLIAKILVDNQGITDPRMSLNQEFSYGILFVLASPFVGMVLGLFTRKPIFKRLNIGK